MFFDKTQFEKIDFFGVDITNIKSVEYTL